VRRSELVAHPLERLIAIAGWGAMLFLLFPVVFTTVVSFGAGELIEFPPAGRFAGMRTSARSIAWGLPFSTVS
jgi:ABC-type spermidine/putrescine transport system permease subunit II